MVIYYHPYFAVAEAWSSALLTVTVLYTRITNKVSAFIA